MHYQMRNWYYYTWLSGDFNVEQHVHYLDICAWAKGAYPVKAIGMGGRAVRRSSASGQLHHYYLQQVALLLLVLVVVSLVVLFGSLR